MESLLKLADVFDRIARFMGKLAGFVVLPLIAIIMFDVITRKIDFLRIGMSQLSWYWLIEPIKLQDMQWHLHAVILLLSFGYAYLILDDAPSNLVAAGPADAEGLLKGNLVGSYDGSVNILSLQYTLSF